MILGKALMVSVAGAALLAGGERAGKETQATLSLVTDRSASSAACGPSAIKWGFMCPIAARWNDTLYAINFTRTPEVAWDIAQPIEAPVAFWKREAGGTWRSVTLDSPHRTYQTPILLLSPDGRANVFTLKPGDGIVTWFQGKTPQNEEFTSREIPMKWGAYLGGGIDENGRALLVYWGNGAADPKAKGLGTINSGYKKSTIGYTLVDTRTGKHINGAMDAPGAPYCYSHVAFNKTGAHILTIKSEVKDKILCGTRNHYNELRYYYSPDPAKRGNWKHVPVYVNDRACIQPLGIETDRAGRVHLLYNYNEELADGKIVPHRLMYAVSKQAPTAQTTPEFVTQEITGRASDGRLFQTKSGRLYLVAYQAGAQAHWTELPTEPGEPIRGWQTCDWTVSQCRLFQISARNGSTVTDDLEGVFLGSMNAPEKSSMFHFRLPVQSASAQAAP